MLKTSDTLRAAAELLEKQGRITGRLTDEQGVRHCAIGAIARVTNVLTNPNTVDRARTYGKGYPVAVSFLADTIRKQTDGRMLNVPQFNDEPSTTDEDMQLMFKYAIHAAEEWEDNADS